MPTEHVLDDTELLNRLRKLGQGNPTSGFRLLCAYAAVCPVCCQPWRASDGECQCTPTAVPRA
jgi:hypothetical protein